MWQWLKSKFSVKSVVKDILTAAQLPAETGLTDALTAAGVTLPAATVQAAVQAVFTVIEEKI